MATRPRGRTTRRGFDRRRYVSRAATFVGELSEERYRVLGGLIDESNEAAIFERHADLFDVPTIEALKRALDKGGEEAERNRSLFAFATNGHLSRSVAQVTDAIATEESRAVIGWRGDTIRYRAARERISTTGERGERNALFGSWLRAVEIINPLRRERLDLLHDDALGLGYGDYVEMVRATRGWNPDLVSALVRSALNDSETGYYAAIRRTLARAEIEQGDGSLADAWYILRGVGWNAWFEPRRLLPILQGTLGTLGMDLTQEAGIMWDLQPRPNKSSRAFVAPVRWPADVRVLVYPHGGWDDLAGLLHASGHLLGLLRGGDRTAASVLPPADGGLAEAYAYLFEDLLGEPGWLADRLGMTEQDTVPFVDFYALVKLSRIRRLGGQLIYELGLHRGGEHAVHRAMYAGTLGLLAGVQWPEELYLASVEDGLHSAASLRGMMLAGALEQHLATRRGDAWWRESEAGADLGALLAHRADWNAERVVAHLGYDAFDWRPVLRKIRTQLIGEMSGYGGPNITTRAGTRKI